MLTTEVAESEAKTIGALADELEVSTTTLMHEAMALLFCREGVPLPTSLVKHLKAHGRPIPSGAKHVFPKFKFH